jgi:hypothetical protein
MKALRRIGWWCILLSLVVGVLFLWRTEFVWASNQDHRIEELGAEIWANPKRWEGATVDGINAIGWHKNIHVGHGVLMTVTNWKQGMLATLSAFLGMTLAVSAIRKRTQSGSRGNR